MSIRTALILDPMGGDDEADKIVEFLRDMEFDVEPVCQGMGMHEARNYVGQIDLLILDYGGMTIGARDTCKWQVREALMWAEQHPSSLVLIWTWFTAELYQEVINEFKPFANVLVRTNDDDSLIDRAKKWLGIG